MLCRSSRMEGLFSREAGNPAGLCDAALVSLPPANPAGVQRATRVPRVFWRDAGRGFLKKAAAFVDVRRQLWYNLITDVVKKRGDLQ